MTPELYDLWETGRLLDHASPLWGQLHAEAASGSEAARQVRLGT